MPKGNILLLQEKEQLVEHGKREAQGAAPEAIEEEGRETAGLMAPEEINGITLRRCRRILMSCRLPRSAACATRSAASYCTMPQTRRRMLDAPDRLARVA